MLNSELLNEQIDHENNLYIIQQLDRLEEIYSHSVLMMTEVYEELGSLLLKDHSRIAGDDELYDRVNEFHDEVYDIMTHLYTVAADE